MKVDLSAPAAQSTAETLAGLITKSGTGRGEGGLESTGGTKTVAERLERLESGIRARVGAMPAERRPDEDLVRQVVGGARTGLIKVETGTSATLSIGEAAGLEAVIRTDGTRPSLFVANGFTDINHPDVDQWRERLLVMEAGLRQVIAAVGGIHIRSGDAEPMGTGFVIAPGLVVTNRHVLEAIADVLDDGSWILRAPASTTIDFIGEDEHTKRTNFKITRVRFAGPDRIGDLLSLRKMDLAVLEVDVGSDANFPEAVSFQGRDVLQRNHNLCVIGFPASVTIASEPGHGTETEQVIGEIFHDRFGVKRLAPGEVAFGIGEHPDDVHRWVFTHDASTLGGNSGSCVVDLASRKTPVIGIHFGGRARDQNFAHAAVALQQQLMAQNAAFV